MHDDRILDAALRSLPRVDASPDFTMKVLQRVRATQPTGSRSASYWRPILATAAAVSTVTLLGVLWHLRQDVAREAADPLRVQAIRAQHQQMQRDFEALRSLADAAQPVVHVGGNDQLDLVLAWDELPRLGTQGLAIPAVHQTTPSDHAY